MSIVVGVDVAKYFSTYTFIRNDGSVIKKPTNHNNDLLGLNSVLMQINKITSSSDDQPVIIMESTGYFSNRLRDYFKVHGLKVLEINPLMSNSIRNVSIRKVKNDKADSLDLANLFVTSRYNESLRTKLRFFKSEDKRYVNLRVLTRTRYKLSKDRTSLKIRLLSDLEQVMPYYAKVFTDPTCKSSLALLLKINDNLTIDEDTVYRTLKETIPRRSINYYNETFNSLSSCLRNAKLIGRNISAYFSTIKIHIALLTTYDKELKNIDNEILQLSSTLENVALLKTIPGISDTIAPILASEIGDINKFKSAKALVAFCGVDPAVKQSGQYNKLHNKMSKRGAPRLRGALYMAALLSIAKYRNGKYANEVIYDYYQTKKLSKPGNVALGAVMHKLLRIIYSVLKNQKEFVLITPEEQCNLYENKLKLIA